MAKRDSKESQVTKTAGLERLPFTGSTESPHLGSTTETGVSGPWHDGITFGLHTQRDLTTRDTTETTRETTGSQCTERRILQSRKEDARTRMELPLHIWGDGNRDTCGT